MLRSLGRTCVVLFPRHHGGLVLPPSSDLSLGPALLLDFDDVLGHGQGAALPGMVGLGAVPLVALEGEVQLHL